MYNVVKKGQFYCKSIVVGNKNCKGSSSFCRIDVNLFQDDFWKTLEEYEDSDEALLDMGLGKSTIQ